MKKLLKVSVFLVIASMLMSIGYAALSSVKGSKNIVETTYELKDFDAIDVSHSFSIEIFPSDEYRVIVKCSGNLKQYLKVYKSGSTLNLGMSRGSYKNAKLSAKIYLPILKELEASGASSIKISEFNTNDMEIDMSGASGLSGELNIRNHLKIEASGASRLNLKGRAQHANVSFSGASKLAGEEFIVGKKLHIVGSGASKVGLIANGEINLDLSGASRFNNYGHGSIIHSKISGASSVSNNQSPTKSR